VRVERPEGAISFHTALRIERDLLRSPGGDYHILIIWAHLRLYMQDGQTGDSDGFKFQKSLNHGQDRPEGPLLWGILLAI
jgi:hypothetical protein